jgi:hypothetical protein
VDDLRRHAHGVRHRLGQSVHRVRLIRAD